MNDFIPTKLSGDDESELCESLAPIIEKFGLATVAEALRAIEAGGVWYRNDK